MESRIADRTRPEDDELTRIVRWRANQLFRAGFGPDEATELARRLDIDLHGAVDLVRHGCPPETAVRILL